MNFEQDILQLLKETTVELRKDQEILKNQSASRETRLALIESQMNIMQKWYDFFSKIESHLETIANKEPKSFWNEHTTKLVVAIIILVLGTLGYNVKAQ